jgi:hypothetical protein
MNIDSEKGINQKKVISSFVYKLNLNILVK